MVAVIKGGCGSVEKKPAARDFAMPQEERNILILVWLQEQHSDLSKAEIQENFDLQAMARSYGLF